MPWGLNTIKVRAQYRMLTLTLSQNPKSHQGQNILKGWMPHGWLHNSGCWPWFWVVSSLDVWWCQGTSSEWLPRCSTSSMAWWPRSLQSLERETKHRDTEKITPWSQQHVHTHTHTTQTWSWQKRRLIINSQFIWNLYTQTQFLNNPPT